MAENQVYLIKSGSNSFVEETQAIVGISGGKVGIGTTVPESFFHVTGDTQIDGDLTVKGNFTTVESTTIQVDDKNIELGVGSTSDAAADGGGITLHGATNKTFNWLDATDAWTSSEHLYLANGKHFSADELRALDADGLKLADQTTSGILIKDGKVGIHQASPAYDLDVSGSGNFDSLYIQGNSVLTGDGSIFGKWEDGATAGEIYYNKGNVGVGTVDPSAQLHVVGSTLLNGNVSASGINAIDANGLILGDDGGNGIFVEDGGQVGINTITPNYNLHVNGTAHVGDDFTVGSEFSVSAASMHYNGGNVGIGTTNPGYNLDVVGSGNFDSLYIQGNSVLTGDGSIFGKWEDAATAGEIYYNLGNVGVGTVDPSAQLHVVGSTLLNGNVSASGINAIDANGLTLGDDAGNGIFVEDGGQVGIGTTAPGYNLDVVGNGNFSQGLYVNGNSVLTGSAADLGKWDEGANSKIFYNDGNVGVGTSDPSVKFEVVGDSLFNGDLSVGSAFSVSTNGSVGGILPTSAGQVVGWDGSKWRPITSAGGGGSSSEVPEAFVQSLASGQSEYTINFTQTYDSAPAISTDLQIDGAGDIIPYAISEVTTSGYSISFAKDLPNDNYKIHTNFGGRDVFWTTGALGSINYSGGDVSIQDSLSVGANLTVQGNAVLTGSAADLGKWDEGVGSEIYYSDGNVGIGTSNPSYTLHVNGTIYNENGGLNVANKFNVSTLGAVGGQSPAFNEVIKWDGSKWIAGSAPGGGTASSSEVPSAFDTWLAAGSTIHPITFVDAPEGGYQSIPSISTDVEIVDGDIIPYAISGVSTTGYYAVFSDPIPTANNYKIHTTFGGKEVYWKTGAGGSSIYYDGDSVSVDDLVVGGNLTVNGTTTTVNTQTVEIEDHNLVIAANTGYNQLTSQYPGAGGAYAGILWGTGDAGQASPVKLTYQTNKGFAFEGGNVGIGTTNPANKLEIIDNNTWNALNIAGSSSVGAGFTMSSNSEWSLISTSSGANAGKNKLAFHLSAAEVGSGASTGYKMVLADSGNVGIGTTNPSSKLTIFNTESTSVDAITLDWEHLTASGSLEQRIKWRFGDDATPDALSDAGYIAMGKANSWQAAASRISYISFATANGLNQVANGGTEPNYTPVERMRISHSGNVGIGTTNPAYTLDVSTSVANWASRIINTRTSAGTSGLLVRNDSTEGTDWVLGVYGNTSYRMVVRNDGNVGIGTTNPTAKLYVNGSTFSTTGWSSSDDRVKHNEQNIVGAIETLGKITPKKYIKTTEMYEANHDFELDADGNPVDANGEPVEHTIEAGVIAQQVLEVPELAFMVSPEGVDEDGNVTSPHGLNYNSLFTYAIAAIQEQQQIIEQLQSQNASLAAQNADFESRISQLEQ